MRIFASEYNDNDCGGNDAGNTLKYGNIEQATALRYKVQIVNILSQKKSKWILCLIVCNSLVVYELREWANSTNSLALRAYANTIAFNVFALFVCLVSVWVSQNASSATPKDLSLAKKPLQNHTRSFSGSGYPHYKKNLAFHFPRHSISGPCLLQDVEVQQEDLKVPAVSSLSILGLEKYEVLALLVSSCLALAAASFIAVEAFGRIKDQPTIHTGRLGLGFLLGIVTHVITVYSYRDAALDHVVCRALPCPTLRGYNPIFGGNVLGAAILCGTHLLIHYWDIFVVDTAATLVLVGLVATSMLPLAFYTASIILQKLPHYMGQQLDKCLREALNIDGVLEFRNERFWTQSFGKLAGTVQVRIRRDANESHVLERVVEGLSRIVTTLTVQEFRETPQAKIEAQNCAEYYINELLPNAVGERKKVNPSKKRSEAEDVETVSIDDILGVEKEPVRTFSSPGKSEANVISKPKTITIYQNKNVEAQKNYLFNPHRTNENALILGSNVDEDRFAGCTIGFVG
ncbi:zinc transporter 6-A-like isoform X1 [Diprion similis]|uniref:zinc transporter 6-A-like isoform X1 n=1 Tax=Diprion similis TaxID=362088 RepID=UPI001EF7EAF8|nr:zinc transporter 6-A-like isoform X1 [Diprion similis]